jgi:hypothetical protein
VEKRRRREGREGEKGKGRFKKDVEEMRRREWGRRPRKVERKRRRNEEEKKAGRKVWSEGRGRRAESAPGA